ncbi:unnamed protein product [Prorocentrum cordatum]|uniref:Uncharacterized protein n=1 Tax=Prorocentrum cordatum TaxID=2364126 RepID=A0ABN9PV88_9DINO|nr:unnamed protein product [Polarella glacialis]
MPAAGKAQWTTYAVALLVQGVPSVTALVVQVGDGAHRDISQRSASRTTAQAQVAPLDGVLVDIGATECPAGYRVMTETECSYGVHVNGADITTYSHSGCYHDNGGWPAQGCFLNGASSITATAGVLYYSTCTEYSALSKNGNYGICTAVQELLITVRPSQWLSLLEVTAYDAAGNTVAALGASMSSTKYWYRPASHCIDGNLGTWCHSDLGGSLKITYPTTTISRVVVDNFMTYPYRIQGASLNLSLGGQTLWSEQFSGIHASYEFVEPTPSPTPFPTPFPTPYPTTYPTAFPTPYPTAFPTPDPTLSPTPDPTPCPTAFPTPFPTPYPTPYPTFFPTLFPTAFPTPYPTLYPTLYPTFYPTPFPTAFPTASPTTSPTPTDPTPYPTAFPTPYPTAFPTPYPTAFPTPYPTAFPTLYPTADPTPHPTAFPTLYPTAFPTPYPTAFPTAFPTPYPTADPTPDPTPGPTVDPTFYPTSFPTPYPTAFPTRRCVFVARPLARRLAHPLGRSAARLPGMFPCHLALWQLLCAEAARA